MEHHEHQHHVRIAAVHVQPDESRPSLCCRTTALQPHEKRLEMQNPARFVLISNSKEVLEAWPADLCCSLSPYTR